MSLGGDINQIQTDVEIAMLDLGNNEILIQKLIPAVNPITSKIKLCKIYAKVTRGIKMRNKKWQNKNWWTGGIKIGGIQTAFYSTFNSDLTLLHLHLKVPTI